MKYLNKYINIRNVSFLLIITVLLSIALSLNPRSSLFYGGVIDHNLVIYLLLIIFLYIVNNIWRAKFENIRRIFFYIPIVSTVLVAVLLNFSFFKSIMDWRYFSSISIFSLLGSIFLFFKYKQIWKKILSLFLIILSFVMFISGEMAIFTPEKVQTKVVNKFMSFYKVSFNDVRPSMDTSWILAKQSFLENKMLGVGPNQFSTVWMKYRPTSSMTDTYYNSNIENASSSFFKIVVEMGVVSILIILVALLKIVELFKQAKLYKRRVAMYNLIHILYIIVGTIMILFVTNDILFLIYYIVLLYMPSGIEEIEFNKDSRSKRLIYVVFIIIIIVLIAKSLSYNLIDRALIKYDTDRNVQALLDRVSLANKLYPNNFANSLNSRIYLQQATDLYLKTDKKDRDDKLMFKFKDMIDKSLFEANLAVYKNLSNPYVYVNRASIYEAASVMDNNYYFDLASQDYNKAIALDPYNPDNMLSLSKLEYAKGLKDKTGMLIDRMLAIKPNYLPAYLTLADMMESENEHNKKAYVLQEALKASPGNQNVAYMLAIEYFKLGLYNDYTLLMDELIKLNPNIEQLKYELKQAKKIASEKEPSAGIGDTFIKGNNNASNKKTK